MSFDGKLPPDNDNSRSPTDTQIGRVETAVAGRLMDHSRGDASLTEIGRHVLAKAYEILAKNDARTTPTDRCGCDGRVRLGISSMLLDFLVDHPHKPAFASVAVTSDICSKIVSAFDAEEIDVAMVMDVREHRPTLGHHLVADFDIEFDWIKAASLVLEPGAPIPLAVWPPDRHIVLNGLSEAGRVYDVKFTGSDYFSKLAAIRSGQCVAVVPRHTVTSPFVAAEDDDLPPIAPKKILLAVRGDPESARFKALVSALSSFRLAGPSESRPS